MLLLGTIVTFSIFVYWYQSMLIRDGFAAEVLHASFKEICIYMIHFVGYYFFQTPHIPLYFLDVLTFISIVSIWLYTFIKYLKEKSNTLFIAFISMSYTMGFSVLNACARAIFGLEGVAAYRYASQFMLFMFGLFFVIKNIKKSRIKILCMVLLFTFLVWKEVHLQQDIINQILSGESIKNTLRLCIQEGHTIESCMDTEHWDPTIPDVPDDPKLSEFLNFLRLRKANVYAP